jgi:DNA-directed RNA polymerase specialized sigma24 family protein
MARIEWVEQRLQNWARWRLIRGGGVLGYASVNLLAAAMPRATDVDAPVPTSDVDAHEVDDAVARLPSELKATVLEVYVGEGGVRQKLARLCVSEPTLHARVGRAHRLLADHLLAKQDRLKDERERVDTLRRRCHLE